MCNPLMGPVWQGGNIQRNTVTDKIDKAERRGGGKKFMSIRIGAPQKFDPRLCRPPPRVRDRLKPAVISTCSRASLEGLNPKTRKDRGNGTALGEQ